MNRGRTVPPGTRPFALLRLSFCPGSHRGVLSQSKSAGKMAA